MLEIARQIPNLEFIDLGGGFGVPYKPDDSALDLESLGQAFSEKMSAFCKEYGKELTLKFEPGRYLVGEAGMLLTEVNTVKTNPEGRTFVGTDTGMHHLVRPAMYGSYHPIRNLTNPNGSPKTYNVVGNICESADFFAKDRQLTEVRKGDILSIDIAGAYGFSMASNYQFRSLPAEVMIDSSAPDFKPRIIRKRQTFEQLIKNYEV
jgi:diaminopimelate decarboxylase